jgi:3-oxoacyl-[acyl-carrier-protein] synthase-3
MLLNSKILGHGYFLPKKILDNNDFLKFVDTSDEWIFSRTGIKQRHIAEKNELTSDLRFKKGIRFSKSD